MLIIYQYLVGNIKFKRWVSSANEQAMFMSVKELSIYSSAEAPSVEKWRENGEREQKGGNWKNRGCAGVVPCALYIFSLQALLA